MDYILRKGPTWLRPYNEFICYTSYSYLIRRVNKKMRKKK